jgi:hypothetical protein
MVNPQNSRDKKERFNIIDDIMADGVKLAIAIGVIILIIIIIFILMTSNKQTGAGMTENFSDYSPMNLTNTPQM